MGPPVLGPISRMRVMSLESSSSVSGGLHAASPTDRMPVRQPLICPRHGHERHISKNEEEAEEPSSLQGVSNSIEAGAPSPKVMWSPATGVMQGDQPHMQSMSRGNRRIVSC